ncbi:hypothetical protein B0H19DRAFT_1072945 [Mycena capillaripes]|nr:hypothetical protein B0H19DRAFT_1072945 [Mycena capillaripes]
MFRTAVLSSISSISRLAEDFQASGPGVFLEVQDLRQYKPWQGPRNDCVHPARIPRAIGGPQLSGPEIVILMASAIFRQPHKVIQPMKTRVVSALLRWLSDVSSIVRRNFMSTDVRSDRKKKTAVFPTYVRIPVSRNALVFLDHFSFAVSAVFIHQWRESMQDRADASVIIRTDSIVLLFLVAGIFYGRPTDVNNPLQARHPHGFHARLARRLSKDIVNYCQDAVGLCMEAMECRGK